MYEELQHSWKGTSWSKKNHKYIKKENNRYYYKKDQKTKSLAYKAGNRVGKLLDSVMSLYTSKKSEVKDTQELKETKKKIANKKVSDFGSKIVSQGKKILSSTISKVDKVVLDRATVLAGLTVFAIILM